MFTYLQHSDPTVPYYREVRAPPSSPFFEWLVDEGPEIMDVCARRASDRRQARVRLDRRVLLEQRECICGLSLVLHRLVT